MTHLIRPVNGHYEAVDAAGNIVVTGDTRREVEDELVLLLVKACST